ncbi:MAG: AI-2E family transporter [Pseudomonadota bacterium]
MTASNPIRGNGILILAALVIIAAGLKASQDLMVPFLLATFIATIAATPMFWMQSKGVPAAFALPGVMIAIVVLVMLLGALVAQSASDFSAQLPQYQSRLLVLQGEFERVVQPLIDPLGINIDIQSVLANFSPNSALQMAGTTLARLGGVLSNSFLIILTVIFILAEAASFPRKLSDILKDPDRDLPHFSRFAENVNRYIAIKTSVSVATGLVITLFLWALGVDFPILWGLLAFLLNYVPTIGSIIAAVPPVLLALIQLGPGVAGIVGIGFLATNIIMGNVVEPKFMGRGLGLSTLVVFLSLVIWGWVLGPVGMLLSVPLTMTAKIALEANPNTQWLAYLLGPAHREDFVNEPTDGQSNNQVGGESEEQIDDRRGEPTA